MDKSYDPRGLERRWYTRWEEAGYFAPSGTGSPYCIMIPPPNVTGSLHMGHAFQDTLMDALIRYHRMRGYRSLWQVGTDHAGIATQMVVERQLNALGQTRHDLGREIFLQRVWDWKAHSGGNITRQLRRLGASLDWSRERFTMDPGLSAAVLEVFVRLYDEGLIYRGQRLVNWDPVLHTAISDLEVVSQEEQGHLWHIRYPLVDGTGHLVVATTRPETLLGDTAIAVHPEDERYRRRIGKEVVLPLCDRRIPVIADDYVDPAFGTGCLKITPAHDFNDYAVGQRHGLPLINIFTADACINDNGPTPYRGLTREQARERVVADLEAAGLLQAVEPHRLMVPRGDRSHSIVEPYLTDQWFVRVAPMAEPAIRAVEQGRIRFVPESWSKTYYEWMRHIEDWCISRQLWWGHRIPAWYDETGRFYVGRNEDEVRARHGLGADIDLRQDPDVLDTWFSSALWPFSTLGWPEETPELRFFYPTSVLVTGFDIIFFWVARMIMMGLKFTGEVPFREVYIHGLVRDAQGQKMAKSKGNVLDPIDVIDGIDLEALVEKRTSGLMQPQMAKAIEKATRREYPNGIPGYGTDALRFTFCALASTGRDIQFDLGRTEGYRNFCNKLWNAARYVLMNTQGQDTGLGSEAFQLGLAERWIIARLQQAEREVADALQVYRFDLAAQAVYEFTWSEYCDWYLELSKAVLTQSESSEAACRGTRRTLVRVLEALLRLAHPFMPFITEEIWQRVAPLAGKRGPTILLQPYPTADATKEDPEALAEIQWLKLCVINLRSLRGEMNISPARRIAVLLQQGSELDRQRVERNCASLLSLARLESVTWLAPEDPAPSACAVALAGEMQMLVPMQGLIDREAELARLGKEIQRLQADLGRAESKLSKADYVDKAPAEVVNKERQRASELCDALAKLQGQLLRVQAL